MTGAGRKTQCRLSICTKILKFVRKYENIIVTRPASPQYKASKHAQILYTRKLARKLEAEGVNAAVSANCPGLVNTKISDGMVSWIRRIFTTAGIFLGKDCRMGAQCTNYQATETMSKKKFNEGFFMDCRQFNWLMNWRAPESRLDEFWEQTQKAMAAWKYSHKIIHLTFFLSWLKRIIFNTLSLL